MTEYLAIDAADDVDAAPSPNLAGQWVRYWSRLADIGIWGLLLGYPFGAALGYLFPQLFADEVFRGQSGAWLFGLMFLPFALAIDAIVLAAFGNTLGRAIAGIRVETSEHERLTALSALSRNAEIYIFGMALGLPIICLIAYSGNATKVREGRLTSWDSRLGTRVYITRSGSFRTIIIAMIAIGIYILNTAISKIDDSSSSKINPDYSEINVNSVDPISVQLKSVASKVKPRMVDDITHLDGEDVEGRVVTYNYTVQRRDTTDGEFEKFFQSSTKPKVCGDKGMSTGMRDYGIAYRFTYRMPNSDRPLVFNVEWDDCK